MTQRSISHAHRPRAASPLSLWIFAALLCAGPALPAQMPLQPDPTPPAMDVTPPAFEVVSIREHSGDNNMRIMFKPNGYEADNLPIKDLIAQAYGIRQDLISGLPEWASTLRFDLIAKVAEEDVATLKKLSPRQRAAMLLPLLVDRFQLHAHKEVRTLPTYDLVVEKGGSKLKVAEPPPATPVEEAGSAGPKKPASRFSMGRGQFSATAMPIATLVNQLAYTVHRTVADKTGLTGKYDIELKWTPDDIAGPGTDNSPDDQAGSIFTALREQLGLRLVPAKGPVDTLVVDHIEKPSPN